MDLLSSRMSRIDSSAIRRMFDLAAKLQNPINLSIGQPHYDAPAEILEAIHTAMKEGKTAYTPTQGILPLREAMSKKFQEINGFHAAPENILISSGISSLISLLLMAFIDEEDGILLTDPCFLMYRSMGNFFKADLRYIPEEFTEEDIQKVNRSKLKIIMYSSPSNPSGYIMKESQIRLLAKLAEETGALLVSDEIYELFDYENQFISAAKIYPRAVTLCGFSKTYSMTGLRLSALAGPPELVAALTKLQQYTVVCAPAPVQWAGIKALTLDMSSYILQYKKNRDLCVAALKDKVAFSHPGGAFYIFAKVPETDEAFVEKAIKEHELLVVPGNIFSSSKNHIRISYAVREDILQRGLHALNALLS